ncbi:GNAT family N-acetyltransferase [Humisphaera borealis]|uniref:GNAT family N-acetyltransferase n=1 Tax=Humisphaera borealis TaxID=2807512 RepID=A0A7M2WYR2_9BACT|nr:GNAT family N-acetyltransferase [Humisphaera borealis]QOV90543.1 GNAT family N-acetyltransferase [Humisphaera borealis]
MRPLSNLHRKAKALLGFGPTEAGLSAPTGPADAAAPPAAAGMAAAMPPADAAIHYRPPRRDELHQAVRMILSQPGQLADETQVADFLRFAEPRRVDLSLFLVAERRSRLLWALLPMLSPGRTALLLSPALPHGSAERLAAGELIEGMCAQLGIRDVLLTQALLDPADNTARDLFLAHRFEVMAELLYLAGEPRKRLTTPVLPPGMAWVGYTEQTHELFKQAIHATYENSLDCPGLNGVRDMEDVIAGHRAAGEFEPKLWRLLVELGPDASAPPKPLGVLLLSPIPQAGSVELVYLGLVPEARGRRLSDLLMRQAMIAVIEQGMSRLTLAVDARNVPALKLYYKHGMARAGSKLALMRDLRNP